MAGLVEKKGWAFASNESFLHLFPLEERDIYDASVLLRVSGLAEKHLLQAPDYPHPWQRNMKGTISGY